MVPKDANDRPMMWRGREETEAQKKHSKLNWKRRCWRIEKGCVDMTEWTTKVTESSCLVCLPGKDDVFCGDTATKRLHNTTCVWRMVTNVQDWSIQCPSNVIWPFKIYLAQNNSSWRNPKLKMRMSLEVLNIICPPQEPTSVGLCHYQKWSQIVDY